MRTDLRLFLQATLSLLKMHYGEDTQDANLEVFVR